MRTAIASRIRQTAAPMRAPVIRTMSFPAPTRGWIRNENLAKARPAGASILDNFFPHTTGVRIRGGSELYATIGAGTRCAALMPYKLGSAEKLFAANTTAIYDITTVADPEASPSAAVSSLTNGDWQHCQFTTSGGTFLVAVNGADDRQLFDGTSWAVTPAITGVTDNNLIHVWVFKNRLFFVEEETLNAWYLSTDAVGGAATKFPLGGVVKLGGTLLFGASWSIDSAGGGLAEKCVFVTSEGEAAVYEGTDPASATTWVLEGVYNIGRPLGPRAIFKAGGDLAIATDVGLISLSMVIAQKQDKAALGASSVSAPIREEWESEATLRVGTYPWHCELWPTKQMLVVAMPSYSTLPLQCFAANVTTGAWCRFTGWDTHCLGLFDSRLFFGTSTGLVIEADVGGYDQGDAYTAEYVGLFDDAGASAMPKQATLMRVVYKSTELVGDKVSISTDYEEDLPTAPSALAFLPSGDEWNGGTWNTSLWSGSTTAVTYKDWRAVSGIGFALAPNWQVTIGQAAAPDATLVKMDLQYQIGDTPG